jgi:hypothetical protein
VFFVVRAVLVKAGGVTLVSRRDAAFAERARERASEKGGKIPIAEAD